MGKKLLILALAAVMTLGILGLAGCDNVSLADYKVTGKALIDTHVATKTQSDYSTEKWAAVLAAAEAGKQAVEEATTKLEVDIAVEKTKESIDMGIFEVEVDDMVELHTWHFTSGVPNNVIKVKHSNEYVVFDCTVDNGSLWLLGPDYEKQLAVKANEQFRWQMESGGTEHAFIDVILRIDSIVIGYSVIEISQLANPYLHTATVLKSAVFEKIGDDYQAITTEQVKNIINIVKGGNLS